LGVSERPFPLSIRTDRLLKRAGDGGVHRPGQVRQPVRSEQVDEDAIQDPLLDHVLANDSPVAAHAWTTVGMEGTAVVPDPPPVVLDDVPATALREGHESGQ